MQYPEWIQPHPSCEPQKYKEIIHIIDINWVHLEVSEDLSNLNRDIATFMDQENQRTKSNKIAHPWKTHQKYCDQMMDVRYSCVSSVTKFVLPYGLRPIESTTNHIVPPHITIYVLKWVFLETIGDIPKPWLVVHDHKPIQCDAWMVHANVCTVHALIKHTHLRHRCSVS